MDGITRLPGQHWTQLRKFAFWFFFWFKKKIGGKIPGNFGWKNRKVRRKSSKKIQGKATNTWMNVWKLWAESKDLNDDIVKHKAKELEECHSRFFAEICKSESSLPVQNNQTVALACQTVLLHFWCYHSCFSTKPQLNTERSFLVPYLNLCFGFTTAVTA